ncbi:MAG: hypothetical protein FWG30_10580 [Eubacteriaceae bacterium]|nr:hypothetical protein [Eubacteriaceae bacterium]
MSMPQFPSMPSSIEDSIFKILSSIAMEEIGLSNIINAEGEKLQYVLGTLNGIQPPNATIRQIGEINESVQGVLANVAIHQMHLYNKMSVALKAYKMKKQYTAGQSRPISKINQPDISAMKEPEETGSFSDGKPAENLMAIAEPQDSATIINAQSAEFAIALIAPLRIRQKIKPEQLKQALPVLLLQEPAAPNSSALYAIKNKADDCSYQSITITADNNASIISNSIYIAQGQATRLRASIIATEMLPGTAPALIDWEASSDANYFRFTVHGNESVLETAPGAVEGSNITVTAKLRDNPDIKASLKAYAINADAKRVVTGASFSFLYLDYGENTFKLMNQNGTLVKPGNEWICGGFDQIPGTFDDRSDVIISKKTVRGNTVKYLGQNPDGSYQKASAKSKLLGTEDDEFVWFADNIVDPDREIKKQPGNGPAVFRQIIIKREAQAAQARVGDLLAISAKVQLSDNSIDQGGVVWKVVEGNAYITRQDKTSCSVRIRMLANRVIIQATSLTYPKQSALTSMQAAR